MYTLPFQTLKCEVDQAIRHSGADRYLSDVVIYDVLVCTAAYFYAAGTEYSDYWWECLLSQRFADIVDSQYMEDFSDNVNGSSQDVVSMTDDLVERARVLIEYLNHMGRAMVSLCSPLAEVLSDNNSVMVIGTTQFNDLLVQINR